MPGSHRLGFDNFSVRAFDWKAPQLIEYAASLKVDTLLLSDLDVYESLDEDYLKKIRAQAEQAGIELQAGTGSICPTSKSYNEKKWGKAEDHARLLIRTAKRLGSSVARCYLGSRRDRDGDGGIYRHIEEMVKVLKAVQSEAEDANVKIAVENHAGDMQAWELVEPDRGGRQELRGRDHGPGQRHLDPGRPDGQPGDPRTVRGHHRDPRHGRVGDGEWCHVHVGQHGPGRRRLAGVRATVPGAVSRHAVRAGDHLLQVGERVQYLKPEFWSRFPKARASEFARFVALAKRGKQYELPPGRPTGDPSAELEQAQQKFDLEESLKYCREVLGLGLKS